MSKQKLSTSKSRYKHTNGTNNLGSLNKHSANIIMNNRLLCKTLEMLSDRIIAFSRQDQFDEETWFKHLSKIFKYMNILEMNKHIQPKFSQSFAKLLIHLTVL